jgi:hypothetical protein
MLRCPRQLLARINGVGWKTGQHGFTCSEIYAFNLVCIFHWCLPRAYCRIQTCAFPGQVHLWSILHWRWQWQWWVGWRTLQCSVHIQDPFVLRRFPQFHPQTVSPKVWMMRTNKTYLRKYKYQHRYQQSQTVHPLVSFHQTFHPIAQLCLSSPVQTSYKCTFRCTIHEPFNESVEYSK